MSEVRTDAAPAALQPVAAPAPAVTESTPPPAPETAAPASPPPQPAQTAAEAAPPPAAPQPEAAPAPPETIIGAAEATPPPPEGATPEPVRFEPFTVPEGFDLPQERISELTSVLTDGELSPQQRGQRLLDMHIAAMRQATEQQQQVFDQTKETWRDQFFSDPEIGGNQQDTTVRYAATARDLFAGSEQQRREFIQMLDATGTGDHPAMIRFLRNVGRALAEGTQVSAPTPPRGVNQQIAGNPAANGSANARIQARYPNTQGMN